MMYAVISPAKKLTNTCDYTGNTSDIRYATQTAQLIKHLKQHNAQQLATLMSLSQPLAKLNAERYQHFQPKQYNTTNATPAVFLFQGDVYRYLDANTLNKTQLNRLQLRVGILSGLYGLLQPLDLIQPYRLEMGTKLANEAGSNLYELWRPLITQSINDTLKNNKTPYLINLASQEYFSAINTDDIKGTIIHIDFKDKKGNAYKTIGINAKRARGAMVRHMIQHNCKQPQDLTTFAELGYQYCDERSSTERLVFIKE